MILCFNRICLLRFEGLCKVLSALPDYFNKSHFSQKQQPSTWKSPGDLFDFKAADQNRKKKKKKLSLDLLTSCSSIWFYADLWSAGIGL